MATPFRITAAEAHKTALASRPQSRVPELLSIIYRTIERESKAGHMSVRDPFAGLRLPSPTIEELREIMTALSGEGYTVAIVPIRILTISWEHAGWHDDPCDGHLNEPNPSLDPYRYPGFHINKRDRIEHERS
jgi:hypothetical protein